MKMGLTRVKCKLDGSQMSVIKMTFNDEILQISASKNTENIHAIIFNM